MAECNNCKNEAKTPENVPYLVHEMEMARAERTIKRLWITTLILIFLLVGSNAAWLWYESQWMVTESWEIVQENDGGLNNYIGNDGDIINGETNDKGN